MRMPFLSLFMTSPFDGMQEHAEKVKECTCSFKQAIKCYATNDNANLELLKKEIIDMEGQADKIKRRVREHIPKGAIMPVDKFQLFRYLKEQDNVIDAVEHSLKWMSYRDGKDFPPELQDNLIQLVDSVIEVIEELPGMIFETRKYFKTFSNDQRRVAKNIIRGIRAKEHMADIEEDQLKQNAFALQIDPTTLFHCIKLAEIIGSIADHAENAADMTRAMLAR